MEILQAASAFSTPTLGAALCILLPDGSQVTSADPGSGMSGYLLPEAPCSLVQAGGCVQLASATTNIATAHQLPK